MTVFPDVDDEATRSDPSGTSVTLKSRTLSLRVLLLDRSDAEAPLAAIVPMDGLALDRIEALTRFWRVADGRPVKPHARLTRQRRQRLRQMLQATDGRLDGATYREIATALYGQRRIGREHWKTSSLRDSTIALVRDGRTLIAGGYLKLLQHRRRT